MSPPGRAKGEYRSAKHEGHPVSQPVPEAKTGVAALDEIFQSVNRGDAPGLVVGVAYGGKTIYRRGFGLASLEHSVANTPSTRMRIASVSKQFTSFAALLLAEAGALDLDAPANLILPELPALSGMPTLRQFMSHTSGYRCFMELFLIGSGMAWQPAGAGLSLQFAQTDVNFAPGDSQLYCNGGYELLSEAIARASGMSFERFMKERVFEPLGLRDTASVPSDLMIVPGLATAHQMLPDGSWMRGYTPMLDNRGAGAMVSTVDDMLRWMRQLRGIDRRVGNDDTWRQLTTVATLNNGSATPYTLGLNRHVYKGVEVLQHGGSLMGVGSQMLTVPAHALDIVIISNGAMVNPVQMAWQIVDTLLAGQLVGDTAALAASQGFEHLFGRRYHAPSGMTVGFGDVGGQLGLSLLNSPPAPILRDRGAVIGFRMEEAGMGPLEIQRAALAPGPDGAAPTELVVSEAGNAERFSLLPAVPPSTADAGKPLPGHYRADDLRADASIAFEGDSLVLRIEAPDGRRAATLEAWSDTVFGFVAIDPMVPSRHVLTLESTRGRLTGFRLSSARARRLLFRRVAD
jgi:CubicO group peptidase (beta-lactamase class C family)